MANDVMRMCVHRALGELTRAMWNPGTLPPECSAPSPSDAQAQVRNEPDALAERALKESPKPEAGPERRELPQFRVLLHNDDLVGMDHVLRSIVELTPLSRARANVVMLMAHTRGVALMLITHRERAELYQQQFRRKGLTVSIEPTE